MLIQFYQNCISNTLEFFTSKSFLYIEIATNIIIEKYAFLFFDDVGIH